MQQDTARPTRGFTARPAPAGRCTHSRESLAAAWDRETLAGPDPTGPGFNPRAGTAARPELSTPPAPGLARFKLGSARGSRGTCSGGPRFPPVTQRPSPHGTGLAACPVDPLTQRLEGRGMGRSGAGGMPGRTHFVRVRTQPWRHRYRLSGARTSVFHGLAHFQGMKCQKRAENGLRSENRPPRGPPAGSPTTAPRRPCARPAAMPGYFTWGRVLHVHGIRERLGCRSSPGAPRGGGERKSNQAPPRRGVTEHLRRLLPPVPAKPHTSGGPPVEYSQLIAAGTTPRRSGG